MEPNWATLWEHLADAVPEAPAVVHGETRLTWARFEERAASFAGLLNEAAIGPGARVALYLYNSAEYLEAVFGTLKERAVPVNVNYRYVDDELAYLLANSGAEALVYHASLAERVARVAPKVSSLRVLLEVEMRSTLVSPVSGALPYGAAVAASTPAPRRDRSGDDVRITYTGGTTGMPKGVVSKVGGHVTSLVQTVGVMLGAKSPVAIDQVPDIAASAIARGDQIVSLPACPLMHGTGMDLGVTPPMTYAGCVVLSRGQHFDPEETWATVGEERVTWLAIVGDPFARPLVRALEDAQDRGRPYDLSSLRVVGSSGAMFSAEVRSRLLEAHPHLTILDYISSTEGLMGVAVSVAGRVPPTGRFTPAAGVVVFDEQDQPVQRGSGQAGRVALSAGVPERYHGDAAKSQATFRAIGGTRYSFPGDWALLAEDGSIELLGRGSQCINSGGEKVFPQEVEEAIKSHPAIEDCLVFGVEDERWGEHVVAVISVAGGIKGVPDDLMRRAGQHLARYKLPKDVRVLASLPRAPSGKADYPAARKLFEQAAIHGSS